MKKPVKLRIVGRDGYTVARLLPGLPWRRVSAFRGGLLLTLRSKQRQHRRRSNPLANQVPNRSRTPVCQALSVVALYAAHSADSASAC